MSVLTAGRDSGHTRFGIAAQAKGKGRFEAVTLVTTLAQLFFPQDQNEFFLLVVVGGMAVETGPFGVAGVFSHERGVAFGAARPHRLRRGVREAEDLTRVSIAVDMRRSRPVTRFTTVLRRIAALEQVAVCRIGNRLRHIIVTRLAGIGADI